MWALVESGSISKVYTRPTQITVGDIVYPRNIFELWSDDQLKTLNIYRVIFDNTNFKDPIYYANTEQSLAFADDKVTATYGTATARNLADLKSAKCKQVDDEAYGLLQPNDWMVIKAQETGGSVESDWTTYRTNMRSTAQSMKTKINAVSDVDALAALYVYNDADPPVRPLGEFPTPPTS
jgi:hypothetical protein